MQPCSAVSTKFMWVTKVNGMYGCHFLNRCFIPVWGAVTADKGESKITGFGAEESFDAFLSMNEPPPVPQGTPARFSRQESAESDEGPDFSIFIK